MNISKSKTCVEVVFVLINQNYLRNLENIINLLDHIVFFTSHEYADNFFSIFNFFNYKISIFYVFEKCSKFGS